MTNLPFQFVGSQTENRMLLPMQPSTLQCATGWSASVMASIVTSGMARCSSGLQWSSASAADGSNRVMTVSR